MSPTLLGAAVAFLGGALLVSWLASSLKIITPDARFVPMQYSTALGFVITGLAVVAQCLGYRHVAFWGGALAAGLGSMALAEQVTGQNVGLLDALFGGGSGGVQMSATTALGFALSGCLLLVWHAPRTRARWRLLATCTVAAALVSAGFAGLLGFALNDGSQYGWARVSGMEAHTALGFLALGTAFFVMVFRIRGEPVIQVLPGWAGWTVGLGVGALTLALWASLTASDARIAQLSAARAQQAAIGQANQIMQDHLRSLRRMAETCTLPGSERGECVRREAESCVRELPGVRMVAWIGRDGGPDWSVGGLGPRELGALLDERGDLRRALSSALAGEGATACDPATLLDGASEDLFVFVPVMVDGRAKGALAVQHAVRPFFDWVFSGSRGHDFDVALSTGGGHPFYASGELRRPREGVPRAAGRLAFADREWSFAGHADGPWLAAGKSASTTLILWFGLFLAGALVVLVRKSEISRQRATSLARAQAAMQSAADSLKQANATLADEHRVLQRTQAELTAAAGDKRAVLDSLAAFIVGVDDAGRVTEWNSVAVALLGLTDEQALGRRFEDLPLGWDRAAVAAALDECRLRGERVRRDNVAFGVPGAAPRMLAFTVNPMQGARGRGFALIGSDVTERSLLEMQLHQAQRLEAVGTLAAGIAHEINTPMQFVSDNLRFVQQSVEPLGGALRLLPELSAAAQAGCVPPELAQRLADSTSGLDVEFLAAEVPAALSEMQEGVHRVTTIVRAMKDFSHPGNQGRQSSDLNKAIATTIAVARNEYKYVADVLPDFGDIPSIECWVADLNQVFLNLLVNAAHAIKDAIGEGNGQRGTIRVSTRHDGDWVDIRFTDSGTGIPEAVRDRIFEQFFTTKPVGKGTGLGLAIARSVVVEKHGGTLSFETEMGKGTTFIVRLPVNGPSAADGAPAAGTAPAAASAQAAVPAGAAP
jgi:PAS domain S-box-containing protein